MGAPLCDILKNGAYEITVTSRKDHSSDRSNLNYIKGNGKDLAFIRDVLSDHRYDVVIDFMGYSTKEFEDRYRLFLNATDQYIFISSARVYAESDTPLIEDSPRLLDVCTDSEYLATDEYALSKARQEDMLFGSGKKNFTIVRPSITYNADRLQLAISEKEEWLYRALHGRSAVFPKDMENIKTTMTYGCDVAYAISRLVGNKRALGEAVHITNPYSNTWGEILGFYRKAFRHKTCMNMKVFTADDSLKIAEKLGRLYQIKYARGINRTFDTNKLNQMIGEMSFLSAEEGLTKCLEAFLDGPRRFGTISIRTQAYFDKLAGEQANLKEFNGIEKKLKYMIARYTPIS